MPWIESHQELRNHPKTKRLARELRISVAAAIGHLHCLWWWATDYAPDGDLTEYEDWEIADAALYEGKNTEKFKDALIFAGFLDNTDGRLLLHDWNDYAGKNVQQRKRAVERMQRSRSKKKETEPQQSRNDTPKTRTDTAKTAVTDAKGCENEADTLPPCCANDTRNVPATKAYTGQDITGQDITGHESTGKESTDTPLNPPEGEDTETPDLQERRFAEFWEAYPKKQGKGAAEKAWKKIRPDAAKHAAIMESVKAHAQYNPQWLKDNGQYIPNPATWLNQKRWEDEKPKATQQTNGGGHDDGGHEGASSGFQRSTGFRRADKDPDPDG